MALSSKVKWDDIRDDLRKIVLEAHLGEFPNDWRYVTIHSIASTLAAMPDSEDWEVDEFREQSHQVADSLVDVCTNDLLQWVAGKTRRHQWYYPDIANQAEPGDIAGLIRLRQYEEIEIMVQTLLTEVEILIST